MTTPAGLSDEKRDNIIRAAANNQMVATWEFYRAIVDAAYAAGAASVQVPREPVAWLYEYKDGSRDLKFGPNYYSAPVPTLVEVTPLYDAAPAVAQEAALCGNVDQFGQECSLHMGHDGRHCRTAQPAAQEIPADAYAALAKHRAELYDQSGEARQAPQEDRATSGLMGAVASPDPDDDLLRRLDDFASVHPHDTQREAAARIRALREEVAHHKDVLQSYRGSFTFQKERAEELERAKFSISEANDMLLDRAERAEAERDALREGVANLKRTFNDEHVDWARRFKLNDATAWDWMTRAESAEAEIAEQGRRWSALCCKAEAESAKLRAVVDAATVWWTLEEMRAVLKAAP